ncbi:MAG: TIGR03086 family protein [Actinobacteria bacterium]|nr:TIGR03086 family protein [Actinomycetota bacterium]
MTDVADRYARLADAFAATVAAVPGERWSSPAPCEGWDARAVVAHVVETHEMFEGLVGRSLGDLPSVGDDPTAAFAAARTAVEAHLRDPQAAGASFEGSLGQVTFAEVVDRFISFDLLIHRWDLATAAGLDARLPADEVQRAWEDAHEFPDGMRSPAVFGPEVPVPGGADLQTRLLGFLGRRG